MRLFKTDEAQERARKAIEAAATPNKAPGVAAPTGTVTARTVTTTNKGQGASTTTGNGGSTTTGANDGANPYAWFDDMLDRNQAARAKSEDEQRRLERDSRLAKIGDVMTAMHQAYSHARGIQPMASSGNLSDKMRQRYEQLEAKRKADEQWWANAKLNIDKLKQARDIARMNADARAAANGARGGYYDERTQGEAYKNYLWREANNKLSGGESNIFQTDEQAREYLTKVKGPTLTVGTTYNPDGTMTVRNNVKTTNINEYKEANATAAGQYGEAPRKAVSGTGSGRSSGGGSGKSKGKSKADSDKGKGKSTGKSYAALTGEQKQTTSSNKPRLNYKKQ